MEGDRFVGLVVKVVSHLYTPAIAETDLRLLSSSLATRLGAAFRLGRGRADHQWDLAPQVNHQEEALSGDCPKHWIFSSNHRVGLMNEEAMTYLVSSEAPSFPPLILRWGKTYPATKSNATSSMEYGPFSPPSSRAKWWEPLVSSSIHIFSSWLVF
jgi:hypothetical protein